MPIKAPVELKMDDSSFSRFFQDAESQFSRGGHTLGALFSSTLVSELNTIGPSFVRLGTIAGPTLSNMTTSFKSVIEAAGGLSLGMVGLAGGVGAAGAAAVIVTKQFYDMGAQWNEITDQLILRTGASTAAIESMKDSIRDIGAVTAAPLEVIGRVLGDVTAQFHQTGAAANALTESVVNIGKNLNQQVDMREMGRLFRLFDVKDASDQLQALNELYSVSASTRIPMNDLVSSLEMVGRSAKDMGLDLGQTAGLIVTLEEAGLSWAKLAPGLQMAMSNWARAGREPAEAFRDTITQMKALIDAGKDVEAQQLAYTQFGRRAWLDIYNAVHDNKLGIDELNQALDSHGRNIGEDTRRVEHFSEEWQKYVNRLKGEVEPAATHVFDVFNKGLGQVLEVMKANNDALDMFIHKLQQVPLVGSIFGTTEKGQVEGGLPSIDTTIPSPWSATHPVPGAPSPFDVGTESHPMDDTGGPYVFPKAEFETKRPERPEVPYGPGYAEPPMPGESYEDWRRRQQQLEDEHNLVEANARLEQVRADNTHSQAQLQAAQNAVLQAQERLQQDQLKPERQPATQKPEVPYGPGFGAPPRPGQTPEQYSNEQAYLEAQHKTAQAQAELQAVQSNTGHGADELTKAQNNLAEAQRNQYQAQLRLNDAVHQGTSQLQDFGAKIDADFGASQGLPGLAENLTKFLANLAFAPVFGALGGAQAATGVPGSRAGSGIVGMIANAVGIGQQSTGTSTGPFGQIGTGSLGQISAGPFGQIGVGPFGINPQQGQAAAQAASRQLYGLPAGTDIRQGAAGFPDWVYQLGGQFNLQASTYAGHQQTNRPDIGALPNPQGLNRGIDWWGSQSDMDRFSQYLIDNGLAEQVIHMDPSTGKRFVYPANVDYSGSLGDETTMVHTRFGQSPGVATIGPGAKGASGFPMQAWLPMGSSPGNMSGIRSNAATSRQELGAGLVSELRSAGLSDDEIRGVLAMNQVESGGNREGFLGFTFGQAATPQAATNRFLNEQWRPRTAQGIPGVDPAGRVTDWPSYMTFLRERIVGQTGVVDWQGKQQPPAAAYQQRLMQSLGNPDVANLFQPRGFQEGGPVPGGGKTANVEPPPWAPDWGYGTTSHGASPDWGGDVRLPYLDENAPDSGPYFKLPGLWQSQWGEKIPNWWYPGLIPGMWRVGGPFGPGPTPRQEGGPIPGAGEVPIVAHEGEHVLTSKDVKAMGGQQGVYDFRAGLHQPKAGPPTPPMTPGAVMPTFGGTLGGPMPAISPIGAVAPPAGHGSGFSVTGGGLVGIVESIPSTVANMAIEAGAAAAAAEYGGAVEDLMRFADGGEIPSVLGPSGGGGLASAQAGESGFGGGSPSGAIISAAINIGMSELNNAVGYGGRAIGAVVSGLQQTFGPDQFAQSKMGQQSWVTRFVGGIMGAQPQLPNLAGMMSQPPPPAPSIMQGTGPFAGTSGKSGGPLVNIENYHANAGEDRAGADIARHTQAAYTESSLTGSR